MSEVNKVYEEINMEYFEKMERLVKPDVLEGADYWILSRNYNRKSIWLMVTKGE